MRVESLDAFALKKYAFQLHKTNNFFTRVTILLSIAIMLASLFLNLPTLSHLWIPRSQLPTMVSTSFAYPGPLTSSLLCYTSNGNASVPQARVFTQNLTAVPVSTVTEEEVRSSKPYLAQKIGSNFSCLNFEGLQFSAANPKYIVQIFSPNATIYIDCVSTHSILSGTFQQPVSLQNDHPAVLPIYYAQVLAATISDTLMTGAQPQVINTFLRNQVLSFIEWGTPPFPSQNMMFGIKLFSPVYLADADMMAYNIMNIVITRLDIGYIVGTILSWTSTLVLVAGVIVLPLMDYQHRLTQAETLFLIIPQLRRPNLFKFVIASFRKGLFPKEDHFVRLTEKVDKLKNVSSMLKLIKEVSKIHLQSSITFQNQIFACQQSFAEPYPEEYEETFYSEDDCRCRAAFFNVQRDARQESKVTNMRKSFLRILDTGSDPISLSYSRAGHGSKSSLCLTLLFAVGLLVFLVIFGVFQLNTLTNIYAKANLEPFQYTFAINEIFFSTTDSAGSDYSVDLLNGNYEYLSTVSLASGTECTAMMAEAGLATYNNTINRCLTSTLTLKYSMDPQQTVLIYFNNSHFDNGVIKISHNPFLNPIGQVSPIDSFYVIMPIQSYDCFYTTNLKVFQKQEDKQQLKTVQFLPSTDCTTNAIMNNPLTGYYMRLFEQITIVESASNSVFDVIQTVWSMTMICFTVILMKITKYINISHKNKRVCIVKAEFRENLCIMLSKVSALLGGKHRGELQKARYFLKQEFPTRHLK